MLLLTSTGTRETIAKCRGYGVGLMMVNQWRNPNDWVCYAIDNGCYSAYAQGIDWQPTQFFKLLEKSKSFGKPKFIVIPDKVADRSSIEFSKIWIPILKALYPDYPKYLPVQDGMTENDVMSVLDDIDGIFVGGSMDWKLETMSNWCKFAHEHGKSCHIGRIGNMRKMFIAELCGADSIDSTTWVQVKGGIDHYIGSYKAQTMIDNHLELELSDCSTNDKVVE